jgi:hypothetical protein
VLKHLYKDYQESDWDGNDLQDDYAMIAEAVRGSRIQIVKWLHEHLTIGDCSFAIDAAKNNSVKELEYLIDNAESWDSQADEDCKLQDLLSRAAAYGSLDACKWLRAQGANWPDELAYRVFLCGDMVKWHKNAIAWARAEGCTAALPDSDYASASGDSDSSDSDSSENDSAGELDDDN